MMSSKSFIFDYGLPGLAAIGFGLLTYMITGGPEEYPDVASPKDETETVSNCPLMMASDRCLMNTI